MDEIGRKIESLYQSDEIVSVCMTSHKNLKDYDSLVSRMEDLEKELGLLKENSQFENSSLLSALENAYQKCLSQVQEQKITLYVKIPETSGNCETHWVEIAPAEYSMNVPDDVIKTSIPFSKLVHYGKYSHSVHPEVARKLLSQMNFND